MDWASGPMGCVYATKATIREGFTVRRITPAIRTEAVLYAEVEPHDAYSLV